MFVFVLSVATAVYICVIGKCSNLNTYVSVLNFMTLSDQLDDKMYSTILVKQIFSLSY